MKRKVVKSILRYTAVFEPCEEGGFTVTVPKLPGLVTEGDSFEEALKNVKDAISGHIKALGDEGLGVPEPDIKTFSAPVDVEVSNFKFAAFQ